MLPIKLKEHHCMGTKQEGRARLRAPWIIKCQLEHIAADGQAFSVVSVAGHSQACVAAQGPPWTFGGPGDCLQHCYAVAFGNGALFPLPQIPPNQ